MEAGRELDALIAEKIMGWDIYISSKTGECFYIIPNSEEEGIPEEFLPKYSSDISAAWEVVEKIGKRFCLITNEFPGKSKAWFQKNTEEGFPIAFGTTPSHAICLAALKAIGI